MVWSIEFGGTADLQAIIQAIGGLTNVVRHQVGATNPISALEKFRKFEPPTFKGTKDPMEAFSPTAVCFGGRTKPWGVLGMGSKVDNTYTVVGENASTWKEITSYK